MPYSTLLTALKNHILTVTINRPDKLNAINKDVMNDLNDVLDEIEDNSDVKAVILTGVSEEGTGHFFPD
jgi:enoyl-CoA hydratase